VLTHDQQRRYARQIQLSNFGEASQEILSNARVLIIGAGGLGAASISYLAAVGVGHLIIADHDRVELSNLNRQILHETGDIGRLKVESAGDRVAELNPETRTTLGAEKITPENVARYIESCDIVVDGCDNFETRHAINQASVALKKPLISAAVIGMQGQLSTFAPHLGGPCYHCFVPEDAPNANTCREAGILGPLCGALGSLQALEAIHTLLGNPRLLGRLLLFNGNDFSQRITALPRDPACSVCSTR
jgi:molybdopterin-synthase adenylyltransferase